MARGASAGACSRVARHARARQPSRCDLRRAPFKKASRARSSRARPACFRPLALSAARTALMLLARCRKSERASLRVSRALAFPVRAFLTAPPKYSCPQLLACPTAHAFQTLDGQALNSRRTRTAPSSQPEVDSCSPARSTCCATTRTLCDEPIFHLQTRSPLEPAYAVRLSAPPCRARSRFWPKLCNRRSTYAPAKRTALASSIQHALEGWSHPALIALAFCLVLALRSPLRTSFICP